MYFFRNRHLDFGCIANLCQITWLIEINILLFLRRDFYWISSRTFALKVFMFLLALPLHKKNQKRQQKIGGKITNMERIEHFRFVTQRSNGTRKTENLKMTKQQRIQKNFSSLMFKRKANAALKMLSASNLTTDYLNNCHKNVLVSRKLIKVSHYKNQSIRFWYQIWKTTRGAVTSEWWTVSRILTNRKLEKKWRAKRKNSMFSSNTSLRLCWSAVCWSAYGVRKSYWKIY